MNTYNVGYNKVMKSAGLVKEADDGISFGDVAVPAGLGLLGAGVGYGAAAIPTSYAGAKKWTPEQHNRMSQYLYDLDVYTRALMGSPNMEVPPKPKMPGFAQEVANLGHRRGVLGALGLGTAAAGGTVAYRAEASEVPASTQKVGRLLPRNDVIADIPANLMRSIRYDNPNPNDLTSLIEHRTARRNIQDGITELQKALGLGTAVSLGTLGGMGLGAHALNTYLKGDEG